MFWPQKQNSSHFAYVEINLAESIWKFERRKQRIIKNASECKLEHNFKFKNKNKKPNDPNFHEFGILFQFHF